MCISSLGAPNTGPFIQPEILADDTQGVHLQWQRIYYQPYDREDSLTGYTLEILEAPSKEWKTLVTGLKSKRHRITDLKQGVDYYIRIRGETTTGELTDPSPPLPILRKKGKCMIHIYLVHAHIT